MWFNLFGKGDPARVSFLLGFDTVLTFLLGVVIFNFIFSVILFISKPLIFPSLASACARPPPGNMPPITGMTGLLGDAAALFRVSGVPVVSALCGGVLAWPVPLPPSARRPSLSLGWPALPPPALWSCEPVKFVTVPPTDERPVAAAPAPRPGVLLLLEDRAWPILVTFIHLMEPSTSVENSLQDFPSSLFSINMLSFLFPALVVQLAMVFVWVGTGLATLIAIAVWGVLGVRAGVGLQWLVILITIAVFLV